MVVTKQKIQGTSKKRFAGPDFGNDSMYCAGVTSMSKATSNGDGANQNARGVGFQCG